MNKVGHQQISMDFTGVFLAGLLQFFKVETLICLCTENLATIVSPAQCHVAADRGRLV